MPNEVMNKAKEHMNNAIDRLNREFSSIRAGRANASLLDRVNVEYYGVPTPINQVAGISIPEARLLVIQPYDKTIIGEIEKAILKSDIGITPSNDGNLIRLAIPALTEERRKEIVKGVKSTAEDLKIMIRNARRDANDEFKKLEKDSLITEDELHRNGDEIQKLTDSYIKKIDDLAQAKEEEIMEI